MKIACDHCENVAEEDQIMRWYEVTTIGVNVSDFDGRELGGRFCSTGCLLAEVGDWARHIDPGREQ